ncbi:hypothetical protein FRB99_006711 [Tulasnella sp. 403]|nr:hypothetical protein FRB99_006711 [Tulasnella sp. 403]
MPTLTKSKAADKPPPRTTTRSRQPPSRSQTSKSQGSVDEQLAAQLASKLQIAAVSGEEKGEPVAGPSRRTPRTATTNAQAKPTVRKAMKVIEEAHVTEEPLTEGERVNQITGAYNGASKAVVELHQSGWKASMHKPVAPSKKGSKGDAGVDGAAVVRSWRSATGDVRGVVKKDKVLAVERTVVGLVGKVIEMELVEEALEMLREVKGSLLRLYEHSEDGTLEDGKDEATAGKTKPGGPSTVRGTAKQASVGFVFPEFADVHALPLPLEERPPDRALLDVLAMFQLHAITAMAKVVKSTTQPAFDQVLRRPGNLLDWYPIYSSAEQGIEPQRLRSVLNAAARGVSSVDAPSGSLLHIRLWAMQCLAPSGAITPDKFWEQVVTCAKVFAKSAEPTGEDAFCDSSEGWD